MLIIVSLISSTGYAYLAVWPVHSNNGYHL